MLHCSNIYPLCLNLCSILTYYAQVMPNYLCLSSHVLLIISSLWINNKWLKHKLTCQKCISQKRSIYSNRTVSYVRVTDCSIRVYRFFCDSYFDKQEFILLHKYSTYYAGIMLNAFSTNYAHNYASIIDGSLVSPSHLSLRICS